MKSKVVRTVLLIVVVALLGWYAVYEKDTAEHQQAIEAEARKLARFAEADVSVVTLITTEGKITAKRQLTGKWNIEEPVNWAAEDNVLESLIRTVRSAEKTRSWYVPADSLHLYGLDPPEARVIFDFRDPTTSMDTLDVGGTTPTDARCYVRFAGSDTISTTTASVYSSALKSLFDVRAKTLAGTMEPDMVQNISVAVGRSTMSFERDGLKWEMTSPIGRHADTDSVKALLNALKDARATKFHDRPTNLSVYGLDPPAAQLRMTVGFGTERVEKRFLLGKPLVQAGSTDGRPTLVYAMDASRPAVMEVPVKLSNVSLRPIDSYWDRQIARFTRADINHIQIAWPESTIALKIDSTATWHLQPPHEGTAKRWRINTIVADADLARAKDFAPSGGSYGFEQAPIALSLLYNDDLKARLEFGRTRGDLIYVRSSTSDQIFLAEKQLADKFRVTVDELLERPTAYAVPR